MPRRQNLLSSAAGLLGNCLTTGTRPGLSSYGAKRFASPRSTEAARWFTSTNVAKEDTGDSAPLKLGFIGAGGINFGTSAGCWYRSRSSFAQSGSLCVQELLTSNHWICRNHAKHLERFPDVRFSAVCDLNQDLAQQRIDKKKVSAGEHAEHIPAH